jgi:REP element-mobilizing transposase RayT
MPIRYNPLQKNTYYHIFNRGCNKQQLFFSHDDYQRFYDTIARYKINFPTIRIESFCFLPNHFHFLLIDDEKVQILKSGLVQVREGTSPDLNFTNDNDNPSENISKFMGKVQQSYAMYFNQKYKDTIKKGLKSPVFEGRFKAKIIADQDYLEMIRYYVENNAVKHELVEKPEDWGYSSFDISREIVEYSDEFDPYFE